jgi:hypothetical protein
MQIAAGLRNSGQEQAELAPVLVYCFVVSEGLNEKLK